jgi:hypothetical protein
MKYSFPNAPTAFEKYRPPTFYCSKLLPALLQDLSQPAPPKPVAVTFCGYFFNRTLVSLYSGKTLAALTSGVFHILLSRQNSPELF